jgi:hypothetical protein
MMAQLKANDQEYMTVNLQSAKDNEEEH